MAQSQPRPTGAVFNWDDADMDGGAHVAPTNATTAPGEAIRVNGLTFSETLVRNRAGEPKRQLAELLAAVGSDGISVDTRPGSIYVQPGDNLSKIAARFPEYGDVNELKNHLIAVNPQLRDPNLLPEGMMLNFPGAGVAVDSASMARALGADARYLASRHPAEEVPSSAYGGDGQVFDESEGMDPYSGPPSTWPRNETDTKAMQMGRRIAEVAVAMKNDPLGTAYGGVKGVVNVVPETFNLAVNTVKLSSDGYSYLFGDAGEASRAASAWNAPVWATTGDAELGGSIVGSLASPWAYQGAARLGTFGYTKAMGAVDEALTFRSSVLPEGVRAGAFDLGASTEFHHGTRLDSADAIRGNGIDLSKGAPFSDFGRGFYLTTSRDEAIASASRLYGMKNLDVVSFDVPNFELSKLSSLKFDAPDAAWADFVGFHKRYEPDLLLHAGAPYDTVTGPLLGRFSGGTTPIPRLDRLPQTSLHTPSAVDVFSDYMVKPK